MRILTAAAASLLVLAVFTGCQRSEPTPPSMMHQVLGALQTPNRKDRDIALALVCRDSALVGDSESALLGIPRIEEIKLRDEVAQDCFTTLLAADKTAAAQRIVDLVRNPALRKELAARLSEAASQTP